MRRGKKRTQAPTSLDWLYAQVPRVHCRGQCGVFCRGVIGMHVSELDRLVKAMESVPDLDVTYGVDARRGVVVFNPEAARMVGRLSDKPACPIFEAGRCRAYDARPMVCRLWGAVRGAPCPWGCSVEPEPLAPLEALRLQVLSLGRSPADAAEACRRTSGLLVLDTWREAMRCDLKRRGDGYPGPTR